MSFEKDYDEINVSQIPALEVLGSIGYTLISPDKAEEMRGSLNNVVLWDILYNKLKEFNSFEVKGKECKFSEKNIRQAILDLDEDLNDGLIKTNEKIYNSLLYGRSYEENLSNVDGVKSFNIKYIDWENPSNNVYQVVEEFSVSKFDGKSTARPDIVLFVNGIPLGVIECKRSSVSVKQGISQMLRNQGKDYIPQLFKYVQIVMTTNKNRTKYATTGTAKRFWSIWKEDENSIENEWFNSVLNEVVVGRIPTNQDKNIISLFHPKRVLNIIKYFTLFDKNVKKIARYQQYFAIKEILKTVNQLDNDGNRQSGVIWHTQGSGKSLTMVMLARYILSEMKEIHPKVLVITDRIDLDGQIHQTFNHSRLKAEKASSGNNLVELINNDSADIITSLVHKFDNASKQQKPIESKDIFILIDESHRTQYGELHLKMKKVFPNACYLGFTGTPLMKKEKSTMIKFGRLIHKYTIKDGVDDKAIVPLLYEGRLVEQTVNRNAIDRRLEMITRNLNDKQKRELEKKWSKFEQIASSGQRIRLIADDIFVHFEKFYKTENGQYKAMVATNSKFDAIRYQEAFEEYNEINTAVIISPPDTREGTEEVDQESKDRVLRFWKKMMDKYGDAKKYEDHIKSEFKDGDEIDILIVVDKLLTGFDAPRATVLYVDKPMKDHNLLQAIARVNRLSEGKDYGLVVDYRGLIEKLDEAMKVYSGAGLENFESEDLKGALIDVISIIGRLREAYSNVVAIFKNITNKNDREEYEVLLGDDAVRDEFYDKLLQFGKYMGIALESDNVYNSLGEVELNQMKKALKFYQELRKSVKLRYSDTIDHKEYEAKMRNLMDNYISAEDVIIITAPVDILNKEKFDAEINSLTSGAAKADTIRTRMTKHIGKKYGENPALYKKFSEKIEEILEEYKNQRISEAEYLDQMESLMTKIQEGVNDTPYPQAIRNKPHAQAFYGVIKGIITDISNDDKDGVSDTSKIYDIENILANVSLEVEKIVNNHSKVDWQNNSDVHKKIKRDVFDCIYEANKDLKQLSIDDIDTIIEKVITVAINRF